MAQLYSTGPAYLYVSLTDLNTSYTMADLLSYPAKGDTYFLGTCQTPPNIQLLPAYYPLKADIGGPMMPFDHLFCGEVGVVNGVLNKWNESIYKKLAARPTMSGGSSTRGTYTAKDTGRPVMLSGPGRACCLWVQFPYQAKTVYADQPAAYRFPGSILFGPDGVNPGSPSRRALTFWCGRVYKATDGTWLVYDHTTTNIPAVPPITADGVLL